MNHCFCSVIPHHMLKHIAENGPLEHRKWAISTIATSEGLRARRTLVAQIPVDTPSIAGVLRRTVFNARGAETLPGTMLRSEGSLPSGDVSVDEAYDGAGAVYEMMSTKFGRNSVDGRGLGLDSTVHYGRNYDNAFWDGRQMVYGDGDKKLFNRFTASIDVIGHEHWHGVTQYSAGLVYWDQSGALNEHMSDVFGSLVKAMVLKATVKKFDWIIGSGILAPGVKGVGLRSMKDPGSAYNDPILGKDPQPGHMKNYVKTNDDSGGVHINSSIPNKTFYLVCEQLDDMWQAGKIWYKTLTEKLNSRSNFVQCAAATVQAAADLFGANSAEQKAVKKAWGAVGVTNQQIMMSQSEGKKKPPKKPKKGLKTK